MSGHRQAAVALHALAGDDSDWILAELPASDQQVLRGYLNELEELGFDRATSADAVSAPPVPDAVSDPLAGARAADIHKLLDGEPASLVAQILSLKQFQWRAEYVALQTAPRREQLRRAAPDGAIAAAREERLLMVLRERLAALPAQARETPIQSRWLRLIGCLPWTR